MRPRERREHQRLKLAKPILATIDGQSALVLDIGVASAFIEHYGLASPGERMTLCFRWKGEDVVYVAEVARSTVVRTPGGDGSSSVSHTGVRFVEPLGESEERLADMISTYVGKVLAAQRANAKGDITDASGAVTLAEIGAARRARARGFITYRLKNHVWWRVATNDPRQPEDGFTVSAHEDEDDLEDLCRTYELADEEGRNMIRLIAELSALSSRR